MPELPFTVTALSAFLNDTGTTGLHPDASAAGKKSKVSLPKIYIVTFAFSQALAVCITLIGGGGHLVVQGFLEEPLTKDCIPLNSSVSVFRSH